MNTIYLDIQARMSRFSASIYELVPPLKKIGISSSLLDQLSRSASSVGANYAEARAAESRIDFLHKLKIALKECREARHWLSVLNELSHTPTRELTRLLDENNQLCAILFSSVKTAEKNGVIRDKRAYKGNVNG